MPPTKPKPNPRKRPEKKIKILQVKRMEPKSLLAEYFYPFLGILFLVITFFAMGFGMRWDESGVIGLWVAGIIFVGRQVVQFVKRGPAPKKEEKKPLASMPPKKYSPPELPRVSKDFRAMPPKGDKRYPPPSPFIKPPK
jgi:hypothetical protein